MKFFPILLSCLALASCSSNSTSYDSNQDYSPSSHVEDIRNEEYNSTEQINYITENSELVKELKISGADAQATKRGVVINLPDAFFEFDRYVLTSDAIRALKEISSILKRTKDRTISIEGHTDYIGRVKYNKELSLKRANAVLTELRIQGVKAKEMLVKGFGEGYPIATNNSEAGRSRNRRVEIVISN